MKKFSILLAGVLLFILSCGSGKSEPPPESNVPQPPSHDVWNKLLGKYVNEQGWVNYKGMVQDSMELNKYLDELSANAPSDKWSKEEKMAYWINAYNAFTVKLIVAHYPVKSIKDIGPDIQIPTVNTPWQIEFFKIGGEEMNLDKIEHDILRKVYFDPRIHFVVVCASRSCARLRNEAYTADKLEAQMDDQTKKFLANTDKNILDATKPKLSKYFDWYKGDFEKDGNTVPKFIAKYSDVTISPDADIEYLDYDWSLNEQR